MYWRPDLPRLLPHVPESSSDDSESESACVATFTRARVERTGLAGGGDCGVEGVGNFAGGASAKERGGLASVDEISGVCGTGGNEYICVLANPGLYMAPLAVVCAYMCGQRPGIIAAACPGCGV